MRRLSGAVAAVALVLAPAAWAGGNPIVIKDPCALDPRNCKKQPEGAFPVGLERPTGDDTGPGSNKPVGNSNGGGGPRSPQPVQIRETTYEPTCSTNRPENGGALCNAALAYCPVDGDVAYWLYMRTRNTATGAATPWMRVLQPPWLCFGATEPAPPAVPIEVLIGQELARDFADLPLPLAVVQVRPEGRTLINIATRFSTEARTTALDPVTILGRKVIVTAKADRYDWSMGDGSTYPNAGPGAPAPVQHTFRTPGQVGPTVTLTWSGTFTVEGLAGTFDILGTASTTGPPADLQVLQSRSQLVDKS